MSVITVYTRNEFDRIRNALGEITIIIPDGSIPSMIKDVSEFILQGNHVAVVTDNEKYVYAMRFYFASPIIQKTKRIKDLGMNPDYTFRSDIHMERSLRNIISDIS